MDKLVKRLMLDDIYAIGRNESWFSSMAKKGLHLKKFGTLFVYFEKEEPRETKYRIDYIKGRPSAEQLEVYGDCGWDFVANNGDFSIFSAPEDSCVAELHTDTIEQGFSLSELNKRLRKNLIIISIAMFLFLGMIASIYIFNDEPFLFMIKGQFVQQMLLVIIELYVFYTVTRNYILVRRLRESLLQGQEINHHEDYRRARLLGGILAAIYLPLALSAVFIPFIDIARSKDYTLPEGAANLPVIRLGEIEKHPGLIRKTGYRGNNVDWENRVSYDWSLLAPVQCEIDEHGIIEDEMWDDQSGIYSPSITTRYYQLTFGGLAEKLTSDLIHRYIYRDNVEVREISYPGLDKAYIAEEGTRKHIFAYSDNHVIHITYYGKENIEDIVPLIPQRLRYQQEAKEG